MTKKLLLFSILFLIVPFVSANLEQIEIDINIVDDSKILQTITYSYSDIQTPRELSYSVENLFVVQEVLVDKIQTDFEIRNNTIIFIPETNFGEIILVFEVEQPIFSNNNLFHFFTEFNFNEPVDVKTSIKIPFGTKLNSENFRPGNGMIGSDGQQIMITWNHTQETDLFYALTYEKPSNKFNFWILISLFLLIILGVSYIYWQKHIQKTLLKGFKEDEKKVLEYIMNNDEVIQRDIQKKYNFTRSKVTRMIQRFEERGLVSKEKYGRTNKIRWMK